MRSERTKACDFTRKERVSILHRDGGCIFCGMRYRMEKADSYNTSIPEIMHYIPRSQGGLGTGRNAALGCRYHHRMMDEGPHRKEMRELMKKYLQSMYRDWDEEGLVYRKGQDRRKG